MRLHRFYYKDIPQGERFSVFDKALLHQWRNVFRFHDGDTVILFSDDGRDCVATFSELSKSRAILAIRETRNALMQKRPVTLFPALTKKDRMEWVLQKCTELGVTRFVPVLTERSEKKGFNMTRAQKIIIEAAEQSGWGMIPELAHPQTLRDVVAKEKNLVACDGSGTPLIHTVDDSGTGLLIGPEGGFSPAELELFRGNNIPIHTLGPSTLRAETAAIVAITLLLNK